MTLKVLHAIPSLVGGGAERQLSLLAPELCRLGVDTHVAYVHPGFNLAHLLDTPVVLHRMTGSGNHDPRILLKFVQLIRRLRPDVVQTWLPQMDVFAGIAALLTGTPFVLSERSSGLAYPGGWKIRLRRQVGRHADAVVANSQGGADYWGADVALRRVIRNGLALQTLRAAQPASPETIELPADSRIVLFAGRLNPEKNVATLLDALEDVLARHVDIAAVLFGDGPLRASLEAKVLDMRTRDRIRLAGFTPDLWRWMRRASVFVSASHFEGNPNAVLEAMAIGCPLVVSDIEQHREILDDTSAYFCNQTEPASIAHAINAVLEAPEVGAARANAASRIVSDWSIEHAAQNYYRLYRELASRPQPAERTASP
jgi:glycosyltransferase involved in cell wall biosynthesis